MHAFATLIAAFLLASGALADPPKVTSMSAELEMKDFHDSASVSGPIEAGVPVTFKFKNNTTVKIIPISIQDKLIQLKTRLVRASGGELYNATFMTRYNAEAELSEKKPGGDLIYRLKLNPHIHTDN